MPTLLRPLFLLAVAQLSPELHSAADPRVAREMPAGYTPCKIVKQERAIFPPRLLQEGIARGEAHVIVEVDTNGQVTDALITVYTHRAFAEEGLRVARASRYAPGMADSQPFVSIVQLQFNFDSPHMIATTQIGLTDLNAGPAGERYEYFPVSLSALDRRPAVRQTTAPIYPQAWIDAGRKGTITVSFYIDETGRVRMPVAPEAHDDLLATAACAALKDWRFDPPQRRGRPVLARVELPIVFEPPPKPAPQP